ncbi:endo-1,4-beta-xylanase [Verrucomicrobiota bacterium]
MTLLNSVETVSLNFSAFSLSLFGKEILIDWFRIAEEANPNFKRYINDFGILSGSSKDRREEYRDLIKHLVDNKAPLDGIGFQCHFREPVPPEEIFKRIKLFEEFDKDLQVTEYDFDITDEELQAQFTKDFMTVIFSHPRMTGLITWTVWAGNPASRRTNAAFFTEDWKKKRIASAWEHMIKEKWMTDEKAETDKQGMVNIRGFLGDYSITITHEGTEKSIKHSLKKNSKELILKLETGN